jgi:hypothetical protein
MVKVRIKFLILMAIAFVFAYLQGGNLPYSVFYGFLVTFTFALGCLLIHRYLIFVDVRFERKVYSSGEIDRFTMIVRNNSIIPAPYVIVKNKALSGINNKYNGEMVTLKLDESKWLKHEIYFKKRGIYNFGEITVGLKDLFCIAESYRNVDRKTIIKVYPKIYDLEKSVLKGSDIFKNAVSNKSSIEDMYSMKDIRKYRDGDNLKRINWKVSAKYNELYVRNFDTVSGQEFNIFLDMNEKNYELDGNGILEEQMIDFCVSIINNMLVKEIKTKLFVNAAQPESFEIEEKVDFDKLMEYFLIHKSDGSFNFLKFINSNAYHISSLSGIGIITGRVSSQLTSSLMELKDRGYNILLFYCGTNNDEINNVDLLEKVGVSCYSIENMLRFDNKARIG